QSTDDAATTVLDVNGADLRGVSIEANGVLFGSVGRGFTVTGARRDGVFVTDVTNVSIEGNVATHNGSNANDAFFVQGSNNTVNKNIAQQNSRAGFGIHGSGHTVTGNVSSSNLEGFEVTATGLFRDNSAVGNSSHGFVGGSLGLVVQRNAFVG